MAPKADDFRAELRRLLKKAEDLGFVAVDINSGNLHRMVGGYPGPDHRMPTCCDVMYSEMSAKDERVSQTESTLGASVVVRYYLPRTGA